jgi:hypothetical protein
MLMLVAAWAGPAFAQGTEKSLALGGLTGVLINTQTLSPSTVDDASVDVDVTSVTVGTDATYYVTRRLGVGFLISYQSVSFTAPESDQVKMSGGLFGPLVKFRVPVGPRADVVLSGGGGLARSTFDFGTPSGGTKSTGTFWMGGAGLSFYVAENASFDVGARYQSSKVKIGDSPDDLDSSGFLAIIGFSVYIK